MKTIDPQNEYDQEYFEFDLFMGRREYKMITRRMQRGRHIAAQEGYYVGSIAPYSYSRIKLEKGYSLEIYEEENIVFNIMKKKALEDEGSTNISNHLNELGYKPRKGEYWTKSAVEAILLNETNLGLIKWNSRKEVKVFKDGKIVKTRPRNPNYELYPGKHPAIMTQDEYDRIKFLMNMGDKGGRTTGIGATINLGAEYTLPVYRKVSFGALWSSRIKGPYSWTEGRLSANYAPLKWLDGGVNFAVNSFTASMGWVLNIHPKGYNLFIGMDHILGKTSKEMIPLSSNASITLGMNIAW